jgi:mRNA-degrading endonuclease toxin of MazEF toxin-antitoxin module
MPMNYRRSWHQNREIDVGHRYVPDRNEIIWLDFEPTKGKEIGKYRPALVLSGKAYNQATGLLICCPISTSIRGAATVTAPILEGHKSVVLCHLANIAQRTGATLLTDPANGHILGNKEAGKLWSRSYEKGWEMKL